MRLAVPMPEAIRDYRLLLDRGYASSASLKLVGDRYALDKMSRMILFRGVLSGVASARDAARVVRTFPRGATMVVDGYNVIFTMLNYRAGHPVFVSTDGLVRDAGGAHGRVGDEAAFRECATLLADRVVSLGASEAVVFLDAPVSGSARHAAAIRECLAAATMPGDAMVVPSADRPVRDHEGGIAATSDSVVVAGARSPVFDLARDILESRYGADLPDIAALLG